MSARIWLYSQATKMKSEQATAQVDVGHVLDFGRWSGYQQFLVLLTAIVCVPLGGTLAGTLAIQILPVLGWRNLFLIGGILPSWLRFF